MASRERIYTILTNKDENDKVAVWYNTGMTAVIVLWLVPLWFKGEIAAFVVLNRVCVAIFIVDYLLRWVTADFKLKRGKASFFLYPITPLAILDLISILPIFLPMNASFEAIRAIRVAGSLRAFNLVRHSRTIRVLMAAGRSQRQALLIVFVLTVVFIVVCATVMFNVEPDTFDNFLGALYWSVISLTTIGYGDYYPATEIGRFVAMISAFAGVAIIALPSGIIAAGLIDELGKANQREQEDQKD